MVDQDISDDCAKKLSTAAPLSSRTILDPSIFDVHIGHVSSVFKYLNKNVKDFRQKLSFYLINSEQIAGKWHAGHTHKSSRITCAP